MTPEPLRRVNRYLVVTSLSLLYDQFEIKLDARLENTYSRVSESRIECTGNLGPESF
jgi:hypothetical protein